MVKVCDELVHLCCTFAQKLMVATSSTLHEPVDALADDDSRYSLHEPFRPTIYKWNQRPVYRRLTTPPIVCALG